MDAHTQGRVVRRCMHACSERGGWTRCARPLGNGWRPRAWEPWKDPGCRRNRAQESGSKVRLPVAPRVAAGNFPRRRVFEPRFRTSMVQRRGERRCARTGRRRRQGKFPRRLSWKHLDAEANFLVISPW